MFTALISDQLTMYIPHVLALLRTGITHEDSEPLQQQAIEAYAAFVEVLAKHSPHWFAKIIGQVSSTTS